MSKPNAAKLTTKQLKTVLRAFPGKQMCRVIRGIYDNPSMITHDICGTFYCANVPDIAQKSASRLLRHGLKLLCIPPRNPEAITKSHHWFMCRIGEVEYFDTTVKPANDESFI